MSSAITLFEGGIADLDAVMRIKDEGFGRTSRVMEFASWLSDVYGPRLTNSPQYRAAGDYVKKQMTELDLPSVPEMLQILDESGAELYACELAMKMFKRTKEDLVPQVKEVITAGDFYDLAVGAQIIFT